jgi:hypothetical protein
MRMLSNQRGYRDNRCTGWRDDHGVPIGEVVAEAPRAGLLPAGLLAGLKMCK